MNKSRCIKNKTLLLVFIFPMALFGQFKKITLDEAIKIAQKKSPDYETNINRNQAAYWRYRNYKANFLPQLTLGMTLPEFSNYNRRIINDKGQEIFVNQNQSRINTQLSVSQNIPYTGGTLGVNSQLERINTFGENDGTSYFIVPFSISYSQNSLFYNPFKWDRKIEPLVYKESERDFVESMEKISLRTCRYYFGLLKSQMQLDIARRNVANQDTLLKITRARFKIGKIAENELLQMELAFLNSKNSVTSYTLALKKASQDMARYLGLDSEDIELKIPESLPLFTVDVDQAIKEAWSNRKAVLAFRRKRLEAEKKLAKAKGDNRLKININAKFGISRRGSVFNDLFDHYNDQQNISLSLNIPVFDWGISKSRRKQAEADFRLMETNLKLEKQAFEQEIYLHTLNWSNQRNLLLISEKAQEIAVKRYEIANKKYLVGKITITDLNLARQEKDKAIVQYLNSLEGFWTDYYTLRKLTLYDFINNKKIERKDILFGN